MRISYNYSCINYVREACIYKYNYAYLMETIQWISTFLFHFTSLGSPINSCHCPSEQRRGHSHHCGPTACHWNHWEDHHCHCALHLQVCIYTCTCIYVSYNAYILPVLKFCEFTCRNVCEIFAMDLLNQIIVGVAYCSRMFVKLFQQNSAFFAKN